MIAVLLTVLVSLAQRRRQVGVLRALGASRGYVFAAVWLSQEVAMVAALAAAGAALAVLPAWQGYRQPAAALRA